MLPKTVKSQIQDNAENAGARSPLFSSGVNPSVPSYNPAANQWNRWFDTVSYFKQLGLPMLTNPDQITKVCKDGIDAVTKSTSALTGGASEIGQHFIATAQKTAASQNDAFKEALETKNSEELAELHAKWTADWMETTISHFNRLSQLTSKVVQQTYEPIQAHLDATSRQIKNGAEG